MVQQIKIEDFTYDLPQEKIALHPSNPKDAAKLLVYKNENCSQTVFSELPNILPSSTTLVCNDSKVLPARLFFYTDTQARIELFLLEPILPAEYSQALFATTFQTCTWKCFVGNVKKWKQGNLTCFIESLEVNLQAKNLGMQGDAFVIEFSWQPNGVAFYNIIEAIGKMPLPPYIKREAELQDDYLYQTTYSKNLGSVAAPTAGLHFTTNTFAQLQKNNISIANLTLHVGAGTFKPVKTATIGEHAMHEELVEITTNTLQTLLDATHITAVGTTSCRSLESLYWLGIQLLQNADASLHHYFLDQWKVYEWLPFAKNISKQKSLTAVLQYCVQNKITTLVFKTQILIAPGYTFKMVDCLVTNFHQPQSTLLLLIAAFVGEKNWKPIYQFALEHNFRFLSYGDSSVLFAKDAD